MNETEAPHRGDVAEQVKKDGPDTINDADNYLSMSIDDLLGAIERLTNKLTPILRPELDEPSPPSLTVGSDISPSWSNVQMWTRARTDSVQTATYRINSLIARVDA